MFLSIFNVANSISECFKIERKIFHNRLCMYWYISWRRLTVFIQYFKVLYAKTVHFQRLSNFNIFSLSLSLWDWYSIYWIVFQNEQTKFKIHAILLKKSRENNSKSHLFATRLLCFTQFLYLTTFLCAVIM